MKKQSTTFSVTYGLHCINLHLVIHFCRDVDQVHDMMDDIAEQQDVAKEISEAISNPVAFGHDVDEVS